MDILFLDENAARQRAAQHDKSYASLIQYPLNIDEKNHNVAGEKIKKLYTNGTFAQDFSSFISVSIEPYSALK